MSKKYKEVKSYESSKDTSLSETSGSDSFPASLTLPGQLPVGPEAVTQWVSCDWEGSKWNQKISVILLRIIKGRGDISSLYEECRVKGRF